MAFSVEFERMKLVASKQKDDQKITLKDMCKQSSWIDEQFSLKILIQFSLADNRDALRGFLNGIILACLVHLSASLVITTYSVVIFSKIGATHIDPYVSTITIAVMQLIGTLCSTKFSDSLGRRKLLIISLLGSAFGLSTFSLYSYLRQNGYELTAFEWVPVASLSFVIFITSAGLFPLLFVCTVENFPTKVQCYSHVEIYLNSC